MKVAKILTCYKLYLAFYQLSQRFSHKNANQYNINLNNPDF